MSLLNWYLLILNFCSSTQFSREVLNLVTIGYFSQNFIFSAHQMQVRNKAATTMVEPEDFFERSS